MELYKRLAELRCFTRENMVRFAGSVSAADWQIKQYLKKGLILEHQIIGLKIRRNIIEDLQQIKEK